MRNLTPKGLAWFLVLEDPMDSFTCRSSSFNGPKALSSAFSMTLVFAGLERVPKILAVSSTFLAFPIAFFPESMARGRFPLRLADEAAPSGTGAEASVVDMGRKKVGASRACSKTEAIPGR